MKWPIDHMGCWKSHRVTFAMFEQRCCPQGSICLSCKSSSRHLRGWPVVRCVGTHNRVPLTDELQDCHHGFFVQITITRAIPTHAVDVTRWCSESGQLMHLDYQYYAGDSHQFLVGVAHGLTLLASSLAPWKMARKSPCVTATGSSCRGVPLR